MAVLLCLVTLAIFIGIAFAPPKERIWVLALGLMFGLMAVPMLLEGLLVRVVFSDVGIESHSPWRKRRTVGWDEVSGVTYSGWARWFRVETRQLGPVRVPIHLSGFPALLNELERRGFRVPYTIYWR